MDGIRVVLITDTHYGPLDRARWSARVCETVNTLDADVVCHTGDIADGRAERRRAQAAPLGTVQATRARVYVTGNHEYYSEAQGKSSASCRQTLLAIWNGACPTCHRDTPTPIRT